MDGTLLSRFSEVLRIRACSPTAWPARNAGGPAGRLPGGLLQLLFPHPYPTAAALLPAPGCAASESSAGLTTQQICEDPDKPDIKAKHSKLSRLYERVTTYKCGLQRSLIQEIDQWLWGSAHAWGPSAARD